MTRTGSGANQKKRRKCNFIHYYILFSFSSFMMALNDLIGSSAGTLARTPYSNCLRHGLAPIFFGKNFLVHEPLSHGECQCESMMLMKSVMQLHLHTKQMR